MSKFLDKELLWGEDKIVKYFNRDTLDDARAMNPEIGDMVYITTEDNTYIYKIDEQVSPDPDFYSMSFNGIAVPDYANIENINRIPTPTSTWTADRSGFVRLYYLPVDVGTRCSFMINNKEISSFGIGGSANFLYTTVLPIQKGDIISCATTSTVVHTECNFIPPKFIRETAPIIAENFKNYVYFPNYDGGEVYLGHTDTGNNTQHASTVCNAVPFDGFLYFKVYASSDDSNLYYHVLVNDREIKMGGSSISNYEIDYVVDTIYVNDGDVVKISLNTDGTGVVTLNNITFKMWGLKFKEIQSPVVEYGGDYSFNEQPVLIKDGTTVRQKLDVDGSPIWSRTFTGELTIPANTKAYPDLISGGVKNLLFQGGWWNAGDNHTKLSIPDFSEFTFRVYTYDDRMLFVTLSPITRTDSPYVVYVEYTKTT
jgi:hypothetical protein